MLLIGGGGCALPPVLHDALGARITAVEPDDEVRRIAREYFDASCDLVGGCGAEAVAAARDGSFDLRRAPQAGSGGVEAFLGENCPNPRDLSATSPAPEAFLDVPQHVIFAFRFQNELALFFF